MIPRQRSELLVVEESAPLPRATSRLSLLGETIVPILALLIFLTAFCGPTSLILIPGHTEIPFLTSTNMLAALLIASALIIGLRLPLAFLVCGEHVVAVAAVFIGLLFSSLTAQSGGLFYWLVSNPNHYTFSIVAGVVAVLLALVGDSAPGRRALTFVLSPQGVAAVLIAVAAIFLASSHFRLLFGDDHPGFLYRLLLLREHYPAIPFYNPEWNGGYLSREFFPSGVLNVFYLGFPLLLAINPQDVGSWGFYTVLIAYLFILLGPSAMYLAARVTGLAPRAAAISAILSLAPSLAFGRNAIQFGTLGFTLSVVLLPLGFTLLLRAADEPVRLCNWIIAAIVLSLVLTWHLLAIAFVPLAIFILSRFVLNRRWRALGYAFIAAVLVCAINGVSLWTLAVEVDISGFVGQSTLPGSTADAISRSGTGRWGFSNLWRETRSMHPLLLALVLPALARWRSNQVVWIATFAWLVLVAAVGPEFKPQFELARFVLPAALLAIIPCGALLAQILSSPTQGFMRRRAKGILIAGLLLSPVAAVAMLTGRTDVQVSYAPERLDQFAAGLRDAAGDEGRVFFLGFILHELGATAFDTQDGGHVGLLPAIARVPMFASHYYHVYWSTVDPIPLEYRKQKATGVESFLDLVNASAVVTHNRVWADYCRRHSGYEQTMQYGRFRIFKRTQGVKSYILRGAGEVRTESNGIHFSPQTSESVLKFRYHPRLSATPAEGIELFPVPVYEEELGGGQERMVSYIGVRVSKEILESGATIKIKV